MKARQRATRKTVLGQRKKKASPGTQSEAPGQSLGAGHLEHPKPENQDSQHMLRNTPSTVGNSSGKKKAHKHKSFWPVTPPVTGGSTDREARRQSFMCYPRNPRNINLFVRIPDREDR